MKKKPSVCGVPCYGVRRCRFCYNDKSLIGVGGLGRVNSVRRNHRKRKEKEESEKYLK